jgi:hypothetical protein
MKKVLWAFLAAILCFASSAAAIPPGNHLRLIYISPFVPPIPGSQTLDMGAKTLAGYGGCNSTNASFATGNSVAFNNVQYTGSHSLVFAATNTSVSADSRYKIDGHNCFVPNGTYGQAPTVAPASGDYVLTDNDQGSGTVHVNVIANRWDVTNISGVTSPSNPNGDTTSANQLLNVLQGDPTTGKGPVMGDSVVLRCGTVYDDPQFDSVNSTTGIVTPGDIRIHRHNYQALIDEINAHGYTALTLPDGDWIKITGETGCPSTAAAPLIRHVQFNSAGGVNNNQVIQGFRITGLNFQLDYNGTNGFAVSSAAELVLGSGATQQSFLQIDNNTFQGNTTVVGQRGTQGIFSVASVDQGGGGASAATITFHDNTGGPTLGSGAAYTAVIDVSGNITGWTKVSAGSGYDYKNSGIPGSPPASGAGTWATISCTGCAHTPTATPNMNGLDLVTGILGAAGTGLGSLELYIHDNTFKNLFDGVNITGNQTSSNYSVPTDIWHIGNVCDAIWNICRLYTNATPLYTWWNFSKNIKYATGAFHNDDEFRGYSGLVSGQTYPFGSALGNVGVRGVGTTNWIDAAGTFSSNGSGFHLSGCLIEGNTYDITFANGVTVNNCGDDAVVAFNTLIQDPVNLGATPGPNENGTYSSNNAPIINKYSGSVSSNGQSSYNAVAGSAAVWSGGTPTTVCNKTLLGKGNSSQSVGAYTAPPSDFTTLQTLSAVQSAFLPKTGGSLDPSVTLCTYWGGAGKYFDYVNRVSTAPF